ncbi:MAG: DUF624 domain-containing protein [Corynebacterium sp.]|uniref:DUF624 domain-containing protein n=1 Tax=Corynebacterium sp. TaxID=1720 RepID=UPI0026DB556C|nr:DUF624 domain-containing protein [Corynebacterium sp.]MDO5029738.1 DUF624 domain-containing protein [Corynebacterium sp.]
MDKFFSTDTKFYAAWSLLADLVIINILMIATSFPVLTGGIATRTGAVVTRNMVRDEGSNATRTYFQSLTRNWRTPTIWWLLLLLLTCGISYELYVISRADLGTTGMIFNAGVISGALILLGITAWFFPLCALDDDHMPLGRTLATAAGLAIRHLPRTALAVLAMAIVPLAIFFFPTHLWAIVTYWALIGRAMSWYLVQLAVEPALPKASELRAVVATG